MQIVFGVTVVLHCLSWYLPEPLLPVNSVSHFSSEICFCPGQPGSVSITQSPEKGHVTGTVHTCLLLMHRHTRDFCSILRSQGNMHSWTFCYSCLEDFEGVIIPRAFRHWIPTMWQILRSFIEVSPSSYLGDPAFFFLFSQIRKWSFREMK